jgi:hypothetical protein
MREEPWNIVDSLELKESFGHFYLGCHNLGNGRALFARRHDLIQLFQSTF